MNIWNVNAQNWNLPAVQQSTTAAAAQPWVQGTGALECKLEKTKMVIQVSSAISVAISMPSLCRICVAISVPYLCGHL